VLVPESGDGIQTLKSGVMEIGDLFVVNKADRPGADRLRQEIDIALGIRAGHAFRNMSAHHGALKGPRREVMEPAPAGWRPPVLATVAPAGQGVEELVAAIERHQQHLTESGDLALRRRQRLYQRTREVVERATRQWVWQETRADAVIQERLDDAAAGRVSPYEVAAEILEELKQGSRL